MPTNAASCATAPRIRSTSARERRFGVGKGVSSLVRFIEPCLQDDLRGGLVALRPHRAPAAAGGAQRLFGRFARPALVDERDRQREARFELARKAPRAGRHRVRRAVGMHGQADDQLRRPPFVDQRGNRIEARRCASAHRSSSADARRAVSVLPNATPMRRVPKSNASTVASGFFRTRDHP